MSGDQNQQQFYLNHPSAMGDLKQSSEIKLDPRTVMQKRLEEICPEYAQYMNFSVFSKTKFDENLDDAALLDAARRRYEQSLPLKHIDIVLVQSLDEPPAVEENPEADGADGETNPHETGSIGQKTNQ